jgi:serine/threonine protein kinase
MNIPHEFSHPVRIGRGSFSTVYRAYQRKFERYVVLKILPWDRARETGRIEKEVRVLASLRLPCVPQIYDVVRLRKKVMIVMEWVRGIPLASLMERTLTADISATLASAIIGSLTLLHNNNIVHCDLKPENILIVPDSRIFFVDFGFSFPHYIVGSSSGVIQGTPAYMAPELWSCRDPIDYKKVDLFALGIILRNLLGKQLPAAAAELTAGDPAGRPQNCASFEKTWRVLCPPASDAETLRLNIGSAVEEYTARLLLAGARELHGKGRSEEAYALLTESLEAWPDNSEALDYLQNKFSTPIRTPWKKRIVFATAAAFTVAAALFAAYFLGMHSSSSRDFIGDLPVRSEESKLLSLLIDHHAVRQPPSLPVALREISGGMNLIGTIVVVGLTGKGSLFIDGEQVSRRQESRVAVALKGGTHRVEWFDSTVQRRYGETIEVLPFEIKTISLTRFINGTRG